MALQRSGRTQKFIVGTGEVAEGRQLDKVELYLPDGTALDLTDLGGEPPAPQFNPRGAWVPQAYDQGDAVMHQGAYWASSDTLETDEPGISGAPLVDSDQLQSIWLEQGDLYLDPENFQTADGSPFNAAHPTLAILWCPVTHVGHVQFTFDPQIDQYIGYYVVDPNGTLAATGQSNNSIGMDLDSVGDWMIQLYRDSGTVTEPVLADVVFSAGLIVDPAPAANPWILFAQ